MKSKLLSTVAALALIASAQYGFAAGLRLQETAQPNPVLGTNGVVNSQLPVIKVQQELTEEQQQKLLRKLNKKAAKEANSEATQEDPDQSGSQSNASEGQPVDGSVSKKAAKEERRRLEEQAQAERNAAEQADKDAKRAADAERNAAEQADKDAKRAADAEQKAAKDAANAERQAAENADKEAQKAAKQAEERSSKQKIKDALKAPEKSAQDTAGQAVQENGAQPVAKNAPSMGASANPLVDTRPSTQLSDDELVARIEALKTMSRKDAQSAGIDKDRIIKADRRERNDRKNGKSAAPTSNAQVEPAVKQEGIVKADEAVVPPPTIAEQKVLQEDAKKPVRVSRDAEKPKDIVVENKAEQVKNAEVVSTAVVDDKVTGAEKDALKKAERKRRDKARDNRKELLGAAAVGVAVGVLIPTLGGRVASDEGDRVIVERDGDYYVRRDESALFRRPTSTVEYRPLRGGRELEIITNRDGTVIETVRDVGGYVLSREKVLRNGRRIVLFDSREEEVRRRPIDLPPVRLSIPRDRYQVSARRADRRLFRETFEAEPVYAAKERYSVREIRENQSVRSLVRSVDLDTINFESGSAFVTESQVNFLGDIAGAMLDVIDGDQSAVFLIEGHTDAVGQELYNLDLSDRRAESVARILSDAYGVPAENMVVQGYGESYLKINTQGDERANRRATVRNITDILQTAQK